MTAFEHMPGSGVEVDAAPATHLDEVGPDGRQIVNPAFVDWAARKREHWETTRHVAPLVTKDQIAAGEKG